MAVSSGNNISEKYGFQWIAPERTGSRKVAEILSYYGFTNNGNKVFHFGNYHHSHNYDPTLNIDLDVICSCRNPYSRVLSLYKNYYESHPIKSPENFKKYLVEDLPKGQMLKMIMNPKLERKPNFVLRLENLTQDLLKLPFILDVLTERQVKLMSSHEKMIDEWESFYDEENRGIIYNLVPEQFNFFGYEK